MAEKEYIEREALKQKKIYSVERHEYVVPVAKIDWMPTADVAEVVHGEWILCAAYYDGILNTAKCSVCGTHQPIGSWDYYDYCMYCGAKMDGGAK